MVNKVKNKTSNELVFDTFTLAGSAEQVLTWDTTFMTSASFGKLVGLFELDQVEFLDESNNVISGYATSEYYTVDAEGNLSASPETVQVEMVKNLLNQQYNAI